jgi:hypothetical protein
MLRLMRDHEDAFGMALLDYVRSGEAQEIIEREDGYVEATSVAKYFDPFRRWPGSSAALCATCAVVS